MKYTNFIVMMAAVLAVILAAGCTSAPVKETSTTNVSVTESHGAVRYVELQMMDGSRVGGKYVSETAAFVTIVPMYILDKDGFMTKGSGKEVGIKSSLLTTMLTIQDPSSLVNVTLKTQNDKAAALAAVEKIRQDEAAEKTRIEVEKRNAEIAKRMPTKKA